MNHLILWSALALIVELSDAAPDLRRDRLTGDRIDQQDEG
jgi:hypothetical protein